MRLAVILGGIFLAGSAQAMPLPDCAGEVVVAKAHVTRVEQDGALILDDGNAVILEGIRLPGADRPATLVAQQVLQVLKQLAVETSLVLTSTPPKQDRYGRIRVQAFDHGETSRVADRQSGGKFSTGGRQGRECGRA